MIKQLLGIIFLITFLSFLGYKFYSAIRYMESAGIIIFAGVVILLVVLLAVMKLLRAE